MKKHIHFSMVQTKNNVLLALRRLRYINALGKLEDGVLKRNDHN